MWRRVRTALVLVLAAVSLPAVVAFFGVRGAAGEVYPSPNQRVRDLPPQRLQELDPTKPTVAVVVGPEGANVADVLAPYEVFAATGRFNVLIAAPTMRTVTLTGGLDVVPDVTLTQLASALPGPPDVIVVPQLHGSDAPVVSWLREQRRDGAPLIMSVCVGAGVLAKAGLLDDRPATSNWLGLIGLRRSHPEVGWTEGVRFVDDGDVITTAGVLSGIDGSLRVVERLAGPEIATRTADDLHWSGYRPGGSVAIAEASPRPRDLVALMSAAYRWDRPRAGVLLSEGVGEIELASVFRPYTELSYLATLTSTSVDGRPVRSRHGLTLIPRAGPSSAVKGAGRLLVPGTTVDTDSVSRTLEDADVEVVRLHRDAEFPFDGTLRDIADTYDAASARWVAKSLQYPLDETPSGQAWPWALTIRPLLLAALGVGIVLVLRRLRSRTRARSLPG